MKWKDKQKSILMSNILNFLENKFKSIKKNKFSQLKVNFQGKTRNKNPKKLGFRVRVQV
jgi:hypothetical protein